MSSIRKTLANRENGKRSHGPKTPEGRAISAANATQHGLSGNTLVLTNEDEPAFDRLHNAFLLRFQPADEVESDLILEIVASRWCLRRIWSVETAMLDLEMERQDEQVAEDFEEVDEITRIALAFTKLAQGKGLALLNRYEARLRGQYEKALKNLRELQRDRPEQPDFETNPPVREAKPETTPEATSQAKPKSPATERNQTNPPAPKPLSPEPDPGQVPSDAGAENRNRSA